MLSHHHYTVISCNILHADRQIHGFTLDILAQRVCAVVRMNQV